MKPPSTAPLKSSYTGCTSRQLPILFFFIENLLRVFQRQNDTFPLQTCTTTSNNRQWRACISLRWQTSTRRMSPRTPRSNHRCLWQAQWAPLCHGGEGTAGIPNQTAMHRATLLALNRKKRMELAKETTCRPVGTAGNSARKATAGKIRLKMRWRHYRNLRFFQNNFPKAKPQKFTYRIILRYFPLSHSADRSNGLFAAQNHQWKPWRWKAHSTGHKLSGFLWKSLQVANK